MHTSERGDWTHNISDTRRYYYQQPDEPLGISGLKTTWSHPVTSSTDPRSHLYNHQPGPMRIIPGRRERPQIVANSRRYNQQPIQEYQTGRGKQHPVGILGRQKWSSQQGGSRFSELGTGHHHLRQRAKMHKPFHYGAQNKLNSNMQLMGGNPLPSGGARGIGKSRVSGSKKPSKVSIITSVVKLCLSLVLCYQQPKDSPLFAGIQAHTIIGGQRRGT